MSPKTKNKCLCRLQAKNMTVKEWIEDVLLEAFEDELAPIAAKKGLEEYIKNPKSYSLDEVKSMMNLSSNRTLK